MRLLFGDCVLDVERRELRRAGDVVRVEPQVFDLILHLVENRDHVVSKEALLAAVWRKRVISDSALSTRINAARQALGDNGERQQFIQTISRRGFRFIGDVSEAEPTAIRQRRAGCGRGYAERAVDRRPSLCQLERRSRTGLFRGRNGRGFDHWPVAHPLAHGDRA